MTHNIHRDYHLLLAALVREAKCKAPTPNRTGTPSWRLVGESLKHDFSQGFPILWSKKVDMRGVAEELFWFLRGSTNEHELRDVGVNIWRAWAPEDGNLGPLYGKQWRDAGGIDQVRYVLDTLMHDQTSRRAVVSCWRPDELELMALAPCHYAWQLLVCDGKLHMIATMRSGDVFLGVPYNIASYGLLLLMFCAALELDPGTLTLNIADAHLYENHLDAAQRQLAYYEEPSTVPSTPALALGCGREYWRRVLEGSEAALRHLSWTNKGMFVFWGYTPGPAIRAKVAV